MRIGEKNCFSSSQNSETRNNKKKNIEHKAENTICPSYSITAQYKRRKKERKKMKSTKSIT